MREAFLTVLRMSGTAAVTVPIVLLVRLLLRHAPKAFSYALWAVVLFRLLCPFTLESALSLIPSARTVSAEAGGQSILQVRTGIPAVDVQVNGYFAAHPYQAGPTPSESRDEVPGTAASGGSAAPGWMAAAWLAGTGLLLGYGAVSLLRLRRRLTEAIPLQGEKNVWLADRIPSPFVLGAFRPRIYLPSGLLEEERGYILLHERTHIRRGDHVFRALAWLALAVHWFNPLAWLAFCLAGRDMEMSCDEAVLRRLGRDIRADYSSSLLRLATGTWLPAGPLAFGGGEAERRIKNVLGYKEPTSLAMAAALILVLSACSALATSQAASASSLDPADDAGYSHGGEGEAGSAEDEPAGDGEAGSPATQSAGPAIADPAANVPDLTGVAPVYAFDEDGVRQEGGFPDSVELAVSGGKRLTLVMQEPTDNQDGSSLRTYNGFQVFDGESLIQTITQDDVIQDDSYLFEGFLADYGGLTVQDVSFDGAEDFGVACGSTYNGPQCWFVWDQAAGQFRFSFFSSWDLRVDRDKNQLVDVWRNGNVGSDYYIYGFDTQGNRIQIDHYYEAVR